MSRIGIYGGSFNPPHTGHLLAAEELIRALKLDQLLIIPAADPPHKTIAAGSPGPEARLAMCRAAFSGIPKVEVSDLEIARAGKSYTVDTLTELKARTPHDELFLIMGTDMLLTFRLWREPEKIASLAALVVMRRSENAELWDQTGREASALQRDLHARIVTVKNDCVPVSSTTVRRLIAFGAPDYLPGDVEALIRENGWYLTGAKLQGLPIERLREISLELHDEKRRAHVIGTAETARALAERWGADPDVAYRAGILHDITKALGGREQLHLCDQYDMMLTPFQRENPKLLHAKTGAVVAREIFGESEDLAQALWWHTTGRARMTLLDKILYIADYMEPNRRFAGVEKLRALVWTDLDAAIYHGLDLSVSLLREQGRIIDPDSLEGWEYYRNRTERSEPL